MVYNNNNHVRRLIIITAVLSIAHNAIGQTFNEWFRQKQTQKKYLIEQIAALEVYAGYVEKGYSIVRDGTHAISAIKKGDFNLHDDFFKSLKNVNPKIRNYSKVAEMIRIQLQILSLYRQTKKQIRENSLLDSGEINYYDQVFTGLISQSLDEIEALTFVITSGNTAMKDDERLKKIDGMYANMQDMLAFAQSFSGNARLLALQRQKEYMDIKTSRMLYGIK